MTVFVVGYGDGHYPAGRQYDGYFVNGLVSSQASSSIAGPIKEVVDLGYCEHPMPGSSQGLNVGYVMRAGCGNWEGCGAVGDWYVTVTVAVHVVVADYVIVDAS